MSDGSMVLAIGSAVWLGLLTAISPCPLATNVAALAFVSRDGGKPRRALLAGLLYTAGRSIAYVLLAAVAVLAVGRLLGLSAFLQGTFYKLLGPLLIIVGMVLLGIIPLKLPQLSQELDPTRVRSHGVWAALPLGSLFALSFCPVSAALFFGMLIPLATRNTSIVAIPTAYGLATGLPVALFAIAIALGVSKVGSAYRAATAIERYARPVTGAVLIAVGVYESLRSVFHVL